jgi:hypothetical protein
VNTTGYRLLGETLEHYEDHATELRAILDAAGG